MTDKGLKSYKRNPLIKYNYRKEIINEIKAVDYVIPLNGLLYLEICDLTYLSYIPPNLGISHLNKHTKKGSKISFFAINNLISCPEAPISNFSILLILKKAWK